MKKKPKISCVGPTSKELLEFSSITFLPWKLKGLTSAEQLEWSRARILEYRFGYSAIIRKCLPNDSPSTPPFFFIHLCIHFTVGTTAVHAASDPTINLPQFQRLNETEVSFWVFKSWAGGEACSAPSVGVAYLDSLSVCLSAACTFLQNGHTYWHVTLWKDWHLIWWTHAYSGVLIHPKRRCTLFFHQI